MAASSSTSSARRASTCGVFFIFHKKVLFYIRHMRLFRHNIHCIILNSPPCVQNNSDSPGFSAAPCGIFCPQDGPHLFAQPQRPLHGKADCRHAKAARAERRQLGGRAPAAQPPRQQSAQALARPRRDQCRQRRSPQPPPEPGLQPADVQQTGRIHLAGIGTGQQDYLKSPSSPIWAGGAAPPQCGAPRPTGCTGTRPSAPPSPSWHRPPCSPDTSAAWPGPAPADRTRPPGCGRAAGPAARPTPRTAPPPAPRSSPSAGASGPAGSPAGRVRPGCGLGDPGISSTEGSPTAQRER